MDESLDSAPTVRSDPDLGVFFKLLQPRANLGSRFSWSRNLSAALDGAGQRQVQEPRQMPFVTPISESLRCCNRTGPLPVSLGGDVCFGFY